MNVGDQSLAKYGTTLLILVSGFVLGWLWATKPADLQSIDWLGVMTAFGTVGAVIVSVSLAGAETKRRAKAERRVARFTLRTVNIRLSYLLYVLADIKELWRIDANDLINLNQRQRALKQIEDLRGSITVDDINAISTLSEECATSLHDALGKTQVVSLALAHGQLTPDDAEPLAAAADKAYNALKSVQALLRKVGSGL